MEQVLDFLIRNQEGLFALAGGLVALLLSSTSTLTIGRSWLDILGEWLVQATGSLGWRLPGRRLMVATGSGVLVGAAFVLVGVLKPVPLAAGLPLPALARDAPDSKKLLVFIHGWDGDPAGTWRRFPELAIGDPELKAVNVLTIHYPTFYAKRNLDVAAMGRWLNEKFVDDSVYKRYDGIYVVSHSMGGLIARQMLLANRLRGDNKQYKVLVSIASPYEGASIASLASTLGVTKGFVEDLEAESKFLFNLRENWNALKDKPATYCLTSPQDGIVSEKSATAQCVEYLRYPQWSHTDMVKPIDRGDPRYVKPMSKVKEFL